MKKHWLLLDGYNLAFRSFYAVPDLTRKDGFPTNAIHGWVRTLWKLQDMYPEATLVITFDMGSDARLELQPHYKANRSETPEDLEKQIPHLKSITQALGLAVLAVEGIEADDLIGTLALKLSDEGDKVTIVSADKDLGQCLKEGVEQLLPPPTANPRLGWRRLDAAGLEDKLGIRPDQVADYLALIGDSSDNIHGLQGVGPKTASKWLQEFGTLKEIIANVDQVKPVRFQEQIKAREKDLLENVQMTTLHTIPLSENWYDSEEDESAVLSFFREMEMENSARTYQERKQLF